MIAPHLTTTSRLLEIPTNPTRDDVLPLATLFAHTAAAARYPEKSLAASLRTVDTVRRELRALLEPEARALLTALQQTPVVPPPAAPVSAWLTDLQAAERLGKSLAQLRETLATVVGRHGLGWPWFDGRRWYIPEPAVRPETRAAYLATVPDREPAAHLSTLPPWCARAEAV